MQRGTPAVGLLYPIGGTASYSACRSAPIRSVSMVEVTVARLGLDSATNSYVVILREKAGTRLLPIWIGKPEAESILVQMNDLKRERPLTHDLCKTLITGLGGTLRRVNITRVEKNTYFAEMQLDGAKGLVAVDARPSDSIAIALRLSAPIFAPVGLLTAMEADDGEDTGSETDSSGFGPQLSTEQLQAYLENLRPEDFGKFTP
ncbi:bifunctional nuclease family protein [Gemmatimonas sp.]|uniref:bifunctional nuclease family protein n=1 Tax=Gemmatimonas sp. TaxID=1962908 RepID=UPI0037BF5B74